MRSRSAQDDKVEGCPVTRTPAQDDTEMTVPSLSSWQQRVLEAYDRIRASVDLTPLEAAPGWLANPGECFFKREDLQQTGSFKLRGATNKILSLSPGQVSKGVIAASNGNHGLGVALAAQRAGTMAEIYVSSHVSPAKAARIEQLGASLRRVGTDPLEAEVAARAAAEGSGKVFISPYNDVDVMAGQGTIAVELEQQAATLPPRHAKTARVGDPVLDAVFVAVGGGGLIGGIGAYLKASSPTTEIVGCWPENSRVLYESMKAGRILDVPEQPTLSESTAGGLEQDSVTLGVCKQVIDRSVLVSEAEILAAMRRVRE